MKKFIRKPHMFYRKRKSLPKTKNWSKKYKVDWIGRILYILFLVCGIGGFLLLMLWLGS